MINNRANHKLQQYFDEKIAEIDLEMKGHKKEITRLVKKQEVLSKTKEKLNELIKSLKPA